VWNVAELCKAQWCLEPRTKGSRRKGSIRAPLLAITQADNVAGVMTVSLKVGKSRVNLPGNVAIAKDPKRRGRMYRINGSNSVLHIYTPRTMGHHRGVLTVPFAFIIKTFAPLSDRHVWTDLSCRAHLRPSIHAWIASRDEEANRQSVM